MERSVVTMRKETPSPSAPLSPAKGERALVLLGEFGRAVGLKGEIRLKSLTGDPVAIADYGPLQSEDGRRFTIMDGRFVGENMIVAKVAEIKTREAAEALNRVKLYIDRAALPEPDEEEFYYTDLIGLEVEDETGALIGKVKSLFNHGAGDFLEITQHDGPLLTIPFTKKTVPVVDVKGGRVGVILDVLSPSEEGQG
jgi:16S rRNA processing protein RimM